MREDVNDFGDVFDNIIKNVSDRHVSNYFTLRIERYIRGNGRIHVHVSGGLSEFCAIFQFYNTELTESSIMTNSTIVNDYTYTKPNADHLDKPMLVSIVNLFEPKKGVIAPTFFGILNGFERHKTFSLVWLQPLNECLMFRAEQANHSFTTSLECRYPCISIDTTPEDGKLERPIPCNCFGWGIQECELVNKLVKSGAQIVGNLPNIDTPSSNRQRRAIHAHAVDVISRLQIEFRPDDVILSILPEGILHQIESLDLLFCTPYLEARAIQRMHVLYYPQGED